MEKDNVFTYEPKMKANLELIMDIMRCDCQEIVYKDKQFADLEAKIAESNESHHKNIVELTKMATEKDRKIEELKQQLVEKDNALKLAREYMFNVMCADDVPSIEWFIKRAKETMKSE